MQPTSAPNVRLPGATEQLLANLAQANQELVKMQLHPVSVGHTSRTVLGQQVYTSLKLFNIGQRGSVEIIIIIISLCSTMNT